MSLELLLPISALLFDRDLPKVGEETIAVAVGGWKGLLLCKKFNLEVEKDAWGEGDYGFAMNW